MMSVFFFFKQKKAYEMRISDWSADVCSSDLRTLCAQVAAELAERVAHVGRGAHLVVGQAVDDHRHAARSVALVADQIGRASCRERVCQYVSISVVAESLQHKEPTTITTYLLPYMCNMSPIAVYTSINY